jgi:uncharacterized membrane protein YphA (DoxX/SURF4 family)
MNDRVPRLLLVILRIHLGVILIITDLGKIFGPRPFAADMVGFISGGLKRPGFGWYHHFLSDVVIPHAALFSILVMVGELVAGISLLTGTMSRAGAVIAMVLFLNYMWTKGRWFWSPDSEDAAVFFSALVVMLGAAGRKLGFDSYLARRWPNGLLW